MSQGRHTEQAFSLQVMWGMIKHRQLGLKADCLLSAGDVGNDKAQAGESPLVSNWTRAMLK